ncbi:fish-egg lectin-like [Xenia sp. Carnegie-2017]|uniref:fish-egg lectin-like n=1 Tax=Xenia sp. Carnegie-2017 TaxID=2897299 RepID=UPI001F04988F|nr:fish-egg lectin-like [Xenia sp. Carnegie-2017]
MKSNSANKSISTNNRQGTGWKHVSGKLKYISCGALGCWGVNVNDRIFYRSGVSAQNCAGTSWTHIGGSLKQIETGAAGDVYGVKSNNVVYRRTGITTASPMGSGWIVTLSYASFVTTGLNNKYVLVNGKIFESRDQTKPFP